MTKYVYPFTEGNASMRNLLGGKGANLAEMTGLGLPVPRGFTISTEACASYYAHGKMIVSDLEQEIFDTLARMEEKIGKSFGDPANPLLVSVRSGARASMPGMMDTILNLGLNDEVVEGLAKLTNNARFANDSYRRFIAMFSDVVMGIDKNLFEHELDEVKKSRGTESDTDLDADAMKEVVQRSLRVYKEQKGKDFPQKPRVQLMEAVKAVFRSWNNDRAILYRRLNGIPGDWGTAVNVQEMVYGNMGDTSGTGVAFTRNPSTGENKLYGEFLMNAQGEDVVAGVRTPSTIDHLKDVMPDVYDQFLDIAERLEKHYRDMQDLEFTIERGKLFILQTRNGKRTATAALRIATELVEAGAISKEEAILRIEPTQLDSLLHPTFDAKALKAARPVAKGLPASPGAASGKIYFTAEAVTHAYHERAERVILVRLETSPEDIEGMHYAQGVLTGRGGMTSHAAVVARGMGKCCVSGCSELTINEKEGYMIDQNGRRYVEGDVISLDGNTGFVYGESLPTVEAKMTGDFATIMAWADRFRTMSVRANADTPRDAAAARQLGAEGIGLTRTEHMFFEPDRIFAFRQMIIAEDSEARRAALAKILPMQQRDFEGIFEAMKGLPVTIRLLDPPLHEFLPTDPKEIKHLAESLELDVDELTRIIKRLQEVNPMLGHRGCRVAITYPEIAEMQTKAIIAAALSCKHKGDDIVPEIMIPLVSDPKELKYVKNIIVQTADQMIRESGVSLQYKVGTMIEIPRAALKADEISLEADFFSFGTNDMTQLVYGLSRDDAGGILDTYYSKNIFEADPTANLDIDGVGRLMRLAVTNGRRTKPQLKIGICGEHGGDPDSIRFCNTLGLDYVSCSPFRVPIAKLAAAQAALEQ
ncbi:MAG TPA: pyruvate, phosphate dikinase [Clostridiaceae bacterium]|nr:pyruvate, phosphate dikinase [Clostridiaceae bacterium]